MYIMRQHMDRTKYTRSKLMTYQGIGLRYEDAWETFREHNQLTHAEMTYLCSFSQGVRDAIHKLAQEKN